MLHRLGVPCGTVLLLLATACGVTPLERLEGDPANVAPWTEPTARRTHPAVDGCQRFVLAVQHGDPSAMWNQLSAETQRALNQRGKPAGLRGIELLQWRKWPRGSSVADGVAFVPLQLFALADIATLQLVATPADDTVVAQNLELTNAARHKRMVTMRFEDYAWRIHNPALAM